MNKTIYLCYKTLPEIEYHSKNWKILNPDWDIKLYDNYLCEQFLLKEYGSLHAEIFNFIPDGPIKSDFWRVCVINKYGGLYVDADIEPMASLSQYIESDDYFVTCFSWRSTYAGTPAMNPHIIFSYKNNEILEKCINIYIDFFNKKKKYSYWDWSIVPIFNELFFYILQKKKIKKGSQIITINNKKYKFLQEEPGGEQCSYKGNIVLNNRYKNYKNHEFV